MHTLIESRVEQWGYVAVFVLMALESACIPIPSEVTMPFAGVLAASGHLGLWAAGVVGAAANLAGSLVAYAVGATGGRGAVLRYGRLVRLRPHHLERAEHWFERYGDRVAFWSRLLPVVRTFVSLPAGVARMPLKRFSLYSFAGSLLWSMGLALGGYELGRNWTVLAQNVELASIVLVVLGAGGAAAAILLGRRRRALRGAAGAPGAPDIWRPN